MLQANQVLLCYLEINEYILDDKSRFLIIASDGLWEFLSNDRVCDIVFLYYGMNSIGGAVERLIEEATKAWISVKYNILIF